MINQMYKETQSIINHIKYLGPFNRSTSADSDKLYPEYLGMMKILLNIAASIK